MMNKMGKKVMALIVVLTSIISFFPAQFIGQVANAATTTSDAATIHVFNGNDNTPTEIPLTTNSSGSKYYSCQYDENGKGKFDIAVNDVEVPDLYTQAQNKMKTESGSISGVTEQKVEITAVNDITWSSDTEKNTTLNALGISVTDSQYPGIIGQRITGMPLGVNRITYSLAITTTTYNYTAATTVTNSDGTTTTTPASISNPITSVKQYTDQNVTIYFGSKYVNSAISPMKFKAYVGDSTYFGNNDVISDETNLENNTVPFLYITNNARPDSDMPLKYTFDVPFSLTKLTYSMTFGSLYSSAKIYKNGKLADFDITTSGNNTVLSGNLTDLAGADDLILIRLGSTSDNISRTFCVELKYSTADTDTDYSIYKAGITKDGYVNDDSVKAYIGKVFTVGKPSDNSDADYNEYTGNIYISQKVNTISIDPTLIVDKDKSSNNRTLAYIVQNHYTDSSGNSETLDSTLSNGKQYVNFKKGSKNVLYVDVYNNGSEGSTTSSSKLVARYILTVNLLDVDSKSFSMNLAFDDNNTTDSTYLNQPGTKNQIDFSSSRLAYDLYTTNNKEVKVSFTGTKSSNNEYLKFWTSTGVNSDSYKEATVSQSGDDYTVDLTGAKKIKVQAYYNKATTTGASASYAVDNEEYVFYLPNNYDSSDTNSGNSNESTNALLNNLKITGATLTDSGGNTGFSSSEYNYTTTVDKGSTTAKITATAQDDNVKSITATVTDTGTTYDLTSGTASGITLDTDGTTTVKVSVTAQDGTTIKTYTVVINNNTKSNVAALKNVILSTGQYTFNSSEDTTKVIVSQNTTSIGITPIPTDSSSTVTVNGEDYSTNAINVNIKGSQKTEIEIIVKSQDGTVSKTYTLVVYRTDSTNINTDPDTSTDDDQYYDEYNDCWVDTTKYEEWGTVDDKPVYFDKNHRQVKNAWISTAGKYYYLNSTGYRSSGWKVDSATGQAYYLDTTTGEMKTGWINLNNTWYYLGLNGVMHKGWLSLNNKWYYFTPNGQMVINQSMYIDNKSCTFGQDGALIS